MLHIKTSKGLTLIEIVIIITIIGAAIPVLLATFSRVVAGGADAKMVIAATNLAQEEMEIIRGQDFANVVSTGPVNFTGTFDNYNYEIVAEYVDEADIDTPVAMITDFKRVQVIITKDGAPDFNLMLSTIITQLD